MVTMSNSPAFLHLKNPKGKNLIIFRLLIRAIVRFSNREEQIIINFSSPISVLFSEIIKYGSNIV
jgi:hypothetical protein